MAVLNSREHAFVLAYLAQGSQPNGSKAAIEAGYSEAGAAVAANRLLKREHIAAEIARRRRPIEKKSELTAQKVMDALNNLVDFDPAQCYGDDGKLLPIKQMPLEARKALTAIDLDKGTIKSTSRLGSLELAAKILQLVKQEQQTQQAVQIIIAQPAVSSELPVVTASLLPEWD